MGNRDKAVESVNNRAYTYTCECPKCGNIITRGDEESTIFCSKCGQKLHLRAFTEEEIKEAIFDREMDEYEDL